MGLSLRDLGDRVALSHAAIKKYEDGQVVPSSDVLLKLSKALNVKVAYFFRADILELEHIEYRRHDDMLKTDLKKIEGKMVEQIERRIELERLFPSIPSNECTLSHFKLGNLGDPEDVANRVRTYWQLGFDPVTDMVDLFEENGIKVFDFDSKDYPEFDGFSALINKNIHVIVIGNQSPGDRQRFTLAHELGHLLNSHAKEQWCNQFAGAFILPKQSLVNIMGEHRTAIEIRELSILKQEFGVSMACILHRLDESGIISKKLYKQMHDEFEEKGWSKVEPGSEYPREKSHTFEQMIFHALAEEYIGESKAAELMNISIESFRSLRAMDGTYVNHYQ